ncbi:hypothetical protein HK098_001998 [Nowakowskiella sp. JEL0407]|nr:hypothetical protein HK098_001998 [Nowakowskiella sp. JEL0407]
MSEREYYLKQYVINEWMKNLEEIHQVNKSLQDPFEILPDPHQNPTAILIGYWDIDWENPANKELVKQESSKIKARLKKELDSWITQILFVQN